MKLIGLTGGIAAGKSTVAGHLAELGAVHIDADLLAREAVAPGSVGLREVASMFGSGVIREDDSLDRPALASIVFADRLKLEQLNAIVHPQVRRLAQARIEAAANVDADAIVVYDVPLLVDAKLSLPWDLVVVVEADDAKRVQRLVELRGMSDEDARRRIENQVSNADRRAVADRVIDTNGTEIETFAQVDALWRALQE